jgi:hypothetical protein
MSEIMSEQRVTKISFPKIPAAYWKALFIASLGAFGFALCVDLNGAETIGTLMLANAAGIGLVCTIRADM